MYYNLMCKFSFHPPPIHIYLFRLCLFFLHLWPEELPSTKLHTILLDHQNVKLTWYIDWPKKEVLFNVDDAFTDETDWFSFGFSKRGEIEGSDVCYFVRNIFDDAFNEAIVSSNRIAISYTISWINRHMDNG